MKTQSNSLLNSNQYLSSDSVPRVPLTSLTQPVFFERYQKLGFPVVMTGLIDPESGWNLDYLCQKLGTREFLLRQYGNHRYQQDKRDWETIGSGVKTESRPFLEYAEMLRSREAHNHDIYLAKCAIDRTDLNETEALNIAGKKLNQLGFDKPIGPFNIWVGPGGHNECLHYDQMDGTLLQLYGTKKVVLFPPSQTSNLYPFPVYVHLFRGLKLRSWFSQLYPDRPDFQSFPKFAEALRYKREVILNPGEILYLPAGWWHEVTALGNDMVCSINRFWRVYPTTRAIFSGSRWRAYLGSICAIPHVLVSLAIALLSPDRKQKIREIRQML